MSSTGPGTHAALGPSSAHRWMACPASVRLSSEVPRPGSSAAAEEGTAAHAVAEILLRRALDLPSATQERDVQDRYGSVYDLYQMRDDVTPYVERVLGASAQAGPRSFTTLEQRVVTNVPGVFGTADAVVTAPGLVHVLDLKFGRGVRVDAPGNPQLRCYALGALLDAIMIHDVRTVRMTIVQPRLNHESTAEMDADDLLAWGDVLRQAVDRTRDPDAPAVPGESQCRWCPAQAVCRVRVASVFDAVGIDLDDVDAQPALPDVMSAEELGRALGTLPVVEAWVKAVKDEARRRLTEDPDGGVPGWRFGIPRTRERIGDADAAIAALTGAGFDLDEVAPRSPASITSLRRVVGGAGQLRDLLGEALAVGASAPPIERVS